MRYLGILAVLLLVSAGGLVCAAALPPSTAGWTLTPMLDGGNIRLLLGIDNAADLAGYTGSVSKTWGDPTLSHENKFISLGSNGSLLHYLTVTLDGDPQISVKFSVTAGTIDSHFSIAPAAPLSFATIPNAKGTATAAVTVTDTNGDGASATGTLSGACFYQAVVNQGSSPLSFCYLMPATVTASPYSSATATNNMPPWQSIGVPVSDIWAEFAFNLSAYDSASGTSSFTVLPVPEPGSLAVILSGLAGLAGYVIRRRRQ